jgi:hypothetical protein
MVAEDVTDIDQSDTSYRPSCGSLWSGATCWRSCLSDNYLTSQDAKQSRNG